MRPTERFPALRSRDFRLFVAGQWISFSGTWMHAAAQGWLVYSLDKSPFYLGLVSAASSLPVLFFSLLGGAVADRMRKRTLLMFTQAASVIPALAVGTLTALGVITVWQVAAFAFLLGLINAFDVPARQSFLMDMVDRENLLNAIALNSAAFNGARMVGPMLAGFIIAAFGIAACFFINAASFLAVLLALALMRTRGATPAPVGGLLYNIGEGLRFVWGRPGLSRPLMLVSVFSLCALPFVSQLPVFAEDVLKVGAKGYGLLMGAGGLGAFLAAIGIAFVGEIEDKPRIITWSSLALPVSIIAFALSDNYVLSLCALFMSGLAVVMLLATVNSVLQLGSPEEMRGRVVSLYTLTFLGFAPIGNLVMGGMAEVLGAQWAVALGAGLCLALSAIMAIRGIGQ